MMAEETGTTPLDFSFLDSVPHTYRLLASGGIAGCVAKTATAPLSRLTILFQVHSAFPDERKVAYARGLVPAVRKVMRDEGFWAFWKGNGTSVLHRFPYAGINFYIYEHLKKFFSDDSPTNETPFIRLMSGAAAGGVACTACYPIDLVRARLTLPSAHQHYSGIRDALRQIATNEGPSGLYRGLGTTLMVSVPNLAISYCIYGSLKEYLFQLKYPDRDVLEGNREEPHFLQSMVCGATSGMCSSLVTYPMDVVRRRLQVRGLHHPNDAAGPLEEMAEILRKDGVRGLYRGLTPELLKVCPMVAITFATYEMCRDYLGV